MRTFEFNIIGYGLLQLAILARTAVAKREVLKLTLDVIQTEAVCQRSVEVVCLTCDFHLLIRTHTAQRTHIVQSVGQLDKQSVDIKAHRVKNLAKVINLLTMLILSLLLLSHSTDQKGHIVTKTLTNLVDSIVGILYHIVQEGCNNRVGTQL